MLYRLSLVFLLLSTALFGEHELNATYMVESRTVKSTALFPSLKKEFKLLSIASDKTKKRISSSEVIDRFAKRGIEVSSGRHRYINFIKKSPIDVAPLQKILTDKYLHIYPALKIDKLTVMPRVYTEELPETYTLVITDKSLQSHEGTFYIKSVENKKLFFDYRLDARLDVVHAKHPLERKEELNRLNTVMTSVSFSRIRSVPLTTLESARYRLKHSVKADKPIFRRDVETSPMVKRGEIATVEIKSGAVLIQFSAIVLQDGGLHDIISIQKSNGQRVKAKVTGLNRVEIQ